MKKLLFLFLFLLPTISFSQYLSVDDVNKVLENGTADFKSRANIIKQDLPLDKNGGITYVEIVEAPNKTKVQLYVTLNAWFLRNFDSKSIILNDKEIGCIMAKLEFHKITANGAFSSSNTNYEVDIEPIIRADIKDGKVRITYNVPSYELRDVTGQVWGRQAFKKDKSRSLSISESYPYNSKGFEKKMMSKALVFTHQFSLIVVEDIKEAIKQGVTGNEADDNW